MSAKKEGSLTEKTGVVVFARILTTVIDLLLAVAIVRILSKTDFAIIGYLLMIHEVARNLAVMGFPESVFYYFERLGNNARRGFAFQTIAILLVTGIVAASAIIIFNFFVPALLTNWPEASVLAVQEFLPLMAIVALFEIPSWPVANILLAADRQKDAAWYEIGTSSLSFIALIIPLWLGFSLGFALWCLVGYAVLRFVCSIVWVWFVLPAGRSIGSDITLTEQAGFSIPLGLSALVGKFNKYIDKFVVSILLVDTAYAEYSVAANEVPIIKVIPFAVGSVLISRYVSLNLEAKKEELLALWYKGIEKVSLLVVPLTILVIVIANDLILLVFETEGTSYAAAVLPFQIYNLIVLIRVTHYGSILQAFGDTKGILYFSLNLLAANIILSIPFTWYFGIVGTALSTLIANIYNWYIILRRIGKHMELPVSKVLPFPFYFKVLGLSVVSGIPIWVLRFLFISPENNLAGLIFGITTFLVMFLALGTFLNIITKEDWRKFLDWISLKFLYK
ncbi:oligosaccharide flippase family protein [Gracilimonas halophila]|uniref:Oligosaccharide flippase family protein n=1 Tax=Gracilimonas halophila TaxID=1834464 RepID=A0ABW5JMM2_9BACT